jgi:hypothetical protein
VSSSDGRLGRLERAAIARLEQRGCLRTTPSGSSPIDFVLQLGAEAPRARVPPPYGIWSFVVDGRNLLAWTGNGSGRPWVDAQLVADVGGEGTLVVLQQGALPASPSYRSTLDRLCDILALWPARAVAAIDAGSWRDHPRLDDARTHTPDIVGGQTPPRHRRRSRLRHWWDEHARYDTWNAGIATLDGPPRHIDDLRHLRRVRWLAPQPPLYMIADPFPYRHAGREWLLVEAYGHPKGVRGRICRADPSQAPPLALKPAIAAHFHVSYPFIFSDGDETYCVPEMSALDDGCLVYRLGSDGEWTTARHILRGSTVVDPTVFRFGGRWWLFSADVRPARNLVLNGYHADDIAGPWMPHALNPLKCDLETARPAGRPFAIDGRTYRPAQDCRQTYGAAVVVMEILELDPMRFREAPALRLDPDPAWPYPDGLHHLVVDGARVYLDAKKTRIDPWLWLKTQMGRFTVPAAFR